MESESTAIFAIDRTGSDSNAKSTRHIQIYERKSVVNDDSNISGRKYNVRGDHTQSDRSRGQVVSFDCAINEDDLYINVNPLENPIKKMKRMEDINLNSDTVDSLTVITAAFEKRSEVPPYEEALNQLRKRRRKEREKTKGEDWYHLPAVDMASERVSDLKVLKMRKALNPQRFYKADDLKALPKYCQFGKIVEDKADFYSSRIPKKQRKASIVDELLHDAQFNNYKRRKYQEIQETKRLGQGPYRRGLKRGKRRGSEKKRKKKS